MSPKSTLESFKSHSPGSFSPQNKTIVITGGGGGIGSKLAQEFASHGAKYIVIADIDQLAAKKTIALLPQGVGILLKSSDCDVSSEEGIKLLIDETESTLGPIDLFVASAGIISKKDRPFRSNGVNIEQTTWDKSLGVNFFQLAYVAKYLIPRFVSRKKGHLLIVSSAGGLLTQIGSLTYSCSKAAAVALAEWLAITYGKSGEVNISCLCPQTVDTQMTRFHDRAPEKVSKKVAQIYGEVISPEEVAQITLQSLREGKFLILPHHNTREIILNKGIDRDQWITQMRKLQAKYDKLKAEMRRSKL